MPLRLETRPIRRSDPSFPSPPRSTSTILATPSRLKLLYGPPANGMAPVTVQGHVSASFRSRAKDWIAAGKQLYSSAASTSRAEMPASVSARSPDSTVPMSIDVEAVRVAQRGFHDREELDRGGEPGARFQLRGPGVGRRVVHVGKRRVLGLLGVGDRLPHYSPAQFSELCLASGDHPYLLLAGRDGATEIAEQRQLEHAQIRQDASCRRAAQRVGD